MRYISTRGQTEPLAFSDAVITGLAPDGGLLVPERIPEVGGELEALSKLSFTGLAKAVLPRFIDDIPPSDLSEAGRRGLRGFRLRRRRGTAPGGCRSSAGALPRPYAVL